MLTFLLFHGMCHSPIYGTSWTLIFPLSGLGRFLLVFGGDSWAQVEAFSNTVEKVESVFCPGAHLSILCFSFFFNRNSTRIHTYMHARECVLTI